MTEQDITLKAEKFNLPIVEPGLWASVEKKDDLSPGSHVLVVYKDRIQPTLWGWWFWKKNKLGKPVKNMVINTRVETLFEKIEMGDPKYLEVISAKRVLILANGFFEWPDKKKTLLQVPGENAFALAGLAFKSKQANGTVVETVSIITIPPDDDFLKFHNRMPVAVPPERYTEWLAGGPFTVDQLNNFFKSHLQFESRAA
ncbi:SOS response-associated peptidase family protein [Bdellovibrio bacteriovorus]|uniref:SOS response-associated peptidase family protein n=1 Tax=Bdellovibrio bacteriovorus TaxID=959 RepID=UPI0035A68D64